MLKKILKSKNLIYFLVNSLIIGFQFFLILFFYKEIHNEIPIWFTKNWGLEVLGEKSNIFLIPIVSILISSISYLLVKYSEKYYQYLFKEITTYLVIILNVILTYSLTQIIKKTTISNLFFLDYAGSEILNSFFISLILSVIITPVFIRFFESYGLITDPKKHQHPGMILKTPSARGGGLVFITSFIITSLLTTKINTQVIALSLAGFFASIIGVLDDISNTSPNKKFRILGNPIFRLLILLPIPIAILLSNNFVISSISNPFGGVIDFNNINFNLWGILYTPIPYIFTFLWIMWLVNLLSWSNGVDGQYSGIIAIAGITISILALRYSPVNDLDLNNAKLAIITAGAAVGLIPYTWSPSKIMWGFGATSAGIILASLSILAETKISISVLVLLIPFMDGVITVIRRILNKQNPLKGDRGHLHHLLLQRGWSVKQVAVFYWISTAILGTIGYISSDKDLPLLLLTLGGIIGFVIALLNFQLKFDKN